MKLFIDRAYNTWRSTTPFPKEKALEELAHSANAAMAIFRTMEAFKGEKMGNKRAAMTLSDEYFRQYTGVDDMRDRVISLIAKGKDIKNSSYNKIMRLTAGLLALIDLKMYEIIEELIYGKAPLHIIKLTTHYDDIKDILAE